MIYFTTVLDTRRKQVMAVDIKLYNHFVIYTHDEDTIILESSVGL